MSSSVSVFLDEEASPRVSTNASRADPFEVIVIGDLTIFTSGGDVEAVGFWDRLRRVCIEAAYRAQGRLDAAADALPDVVIGLAKDPVVFEAIAEDAAEASRQMTEAEA